MPLPPDQGRNPAGSAFIARLADFPPEIGPFRILRQIGAGGMGIVFLAQQEKPTRTVALKIVHGSVISQNTLRRFEQEAEVLARLQHPGIAQIFQIGTYPSRGSEMPYIAMEYVEGERLDNWIARNKPDTRARLELAALIADAVEHAHQKGVIHRDLKPGNILVTAEGHPKILDFGVARLSDSDDSRTTTLRTDMGALLGTIAYMSPEQASGDPKAVDTRSDVYSLGVLLFEMLTDRLPYIVERIPPPEAVRVIREEEPSKISKYDRALRGDVETIVGKALEKDRTRRYPSAQAFADDIRRSLADEPIQARPPSAFYQLSKFAQRNQVLVGAIATVFVILAICTGVATHLYFKEREAASRERTALGKERDANASAQAALAQAKIEEQRASTTSKFLLSIFGAIDPNFARGEDTKLLERILSNARERLASELAGQPEVEAQVREVLGVAYKFMSLFDQAEVELTRAYGIWNERFGPDDRRTLNAGMVLASVFIRKGAMERAEQRLLDTAERQSRALGANDRDTLSTRGLLGDLYMRQRRLKESEELLRAVLADQEKLLGPDHEDVLTTKVTLCSTLSFESKTEEAHQLIEDVWQARRKSEGDDAPQTILTLATRAGTLRDLGRLDEAEADQRDALAASLRIFGADNQQTISMQNNLAITLQMSQQYEEAEELLRDVLARRTRLSGKDHAETLNTLTNLVSLLKKQGRDDEAGPMILDILERTRRALGEDHVETSRAYMNAGLLLGHQRKFAEAAKMFEAVAAGERKRLREDDPQRSLSLYNWAATLQDAGDNKAAEPVLRELLELVDAHGLQGEQFVPAARNALAKVLEERGEREEADKLFRAALDERRRRFPTPNIELAYSLSDYGEALVDRGDAQNALPMIDELLELRAKLRNDKPWLLPWTHRLHARCLTKLGRFEEAEAELLSANKEVAAMSQAPSAAMHDMRAAFKELYEAWDAAEPGKGIAARAGDWQ